MLRRLGADPARCGYTAEQIEHCLRALASPASHQEAAGERPAADHARRGGATCRVTASSRRTSRPHPEVLKLRFDRERSPIDGIPADLRRGLFQIFLEHADGAVRRTGRVWVPTDPLDDPELFSPYRFEPRERGVERVGPTGAARPHLLGELTWPEAERRLKEVDVALLPVGAIEQHGPHLPLDTDAFDADYLARRVAEACQRPQDRWCCR